MHGRQEVVEAILGDTAAPRPKYHNMATSSASSFPVPPPYPVLFPDVAIPLMDRPREPAEPPETEWFAKMHPMPTITVVEPTAAAARAIVMKHQDGSDDEDDMVEAAYAAVRTTWRLTPWRCTDDPLTTCAAALKRSWV